jgi:hypothetical protein
MDDKILKELLNEDKSIPKALVGEWNKIKNRIVVSEANSFKSYFTLKPALSFCSVIILFIVVSFNTSKVNNNYSASEREELISFMVEDSYFTESDELYSWSDF